MLKRWCGKAGVVVLVVLLTVAMPVYAQETATGECERKAGLRFEYTSYRADSPVGMRANEMQLAVRAGNRLEISNWIIDGGCITSEQMKVTMGEELPDGTKVLTLSLTLDGSPCKAFFQKMTKTTVQLPGPGKYKVRFSLHELYWPSGERLLSEKEIVVD